MFSVPQAKVTSFPALDFFKKEIDEKEGIEEKEVDKKVGWEENKQKKWEENTIKTTGDDA